jgi:hypothetical protein
MIRSKNISWLTVGTVAFGGLDGQCCTRSLTDECG